MQLEIKKERVNIQKLICEKKENINVQDDMIVPDSKPDILNTMNTSGIISINKKEIMDGKIRIDGNINTYIMYLAEDSENSIRSLNTTLDFSENFIIADCNEKMTADVEINIKTIECKVLNGRKVNIKIGLETRVKLYDTNEVEFISEINDENMQTLSQAIKVNSLIGAGDTRAYAKDTIQLNAEDNLAEIMKAEVRLVDKDIKTSYNKILAKTEAEFKIMYLTEDNRINTVKGRVPLVGFIDIKDISESNICDSKYDIQNVIIKPENSNENSIYVEIEVRIECNVFEEREINLLQDAYNIFSDVKINKEKIKIINNKIEKDATCSIREKANIQELINNNIITVEVMPKITKENYMNKKIICEGETELNFIMTSSGSVSIEMKTIKYPFEIVIDNDSNCENANIEVAVNSQDFVVAGDGEVNCNVDLSARAQMYRSVEVDAINEITEEESDKLEDYSVAIYIIKKGDTLWNIAKKFRTTVDMIARINGIQNVEKINAGDKIYIPKYVKMSKVEEPKYA